jgi:23S rRNA pseudouridine2605 synthase
MPHENKSSTLPKGFDRLERVIAHLGLASRREAKDCIQKGEVKVNGKVVKEPGFGVKEGKDKIEIKSKSLASKESVLVYKPRGVETNKTLKHTRDLHDEFPAFKHLQPIGRLDKDSEGLIIMSNDGTLAKALTQSDKTVGKEYLVTVREDVSDSILRFMSKGVVFDGIKTKEAPTKKISPHVFSIVLKEGRKHQIRRMCEICRLTIERLVRVKIGHLSVKLLSKKPFLHLTQDDVLLLKSK